MRRSFLYTFVLFYLFFVVSAQQNEPNKSSGEKTIIHNDKKTNSLEDSPNESSKSSVIKEALVDPSSMINPSSIEDDELPSVTIHAKKTCKDLPVHYRRLPPPYISEDQFKNKVRYVALDSGFYLEFIELYPKIKEQEDQEIEKGKKKNVSASFARKKFLRKKRKEILSKYKDKLSKELSRTEGRILLKLVHRKTGKTFYQIINEFLDSWQAGLWNITAKTFDIPINEPYEPKKFQEDCKIEKYLQELIKERVIDPNKH